MLNHRAIRRDQAPRDTASGRVKNAAGVSRRIAFGALVVAGALAGCSMGAGSKSVAPPTAASSLQRYDNAFSYCRAVGTVDHPDARYTGPNPPSAVIAGLITALGAQPSAADSQTFIHATFWRCMGGAVYACNVGANLPCESPADTRSTPTVGERQYCAAHPGMDFIPMYVTGHATVYDWRCEGEAPVAGKQLVEVDARGFIAGIWYKIPPPR